MWVYEDLVCCTQVWHAQHLSLLTCTCHHHGNNKLFCVYYQISCKFLFYVQVMVCVSFCSILLFVNLLTSTVLMQSRGLLFPGDTRASLYDVRSVGWMIVYDILVQILCTRNSTDARFCSSFILKNKPIQENVRM